MAIRFSGDVEVRMQYGGAVWLRKGMPLFSPEGAGFYYASIRAPYLRRAAILSLREIGLPSLSRKLATSSEAYDEAALAFLKWTEKHEGKLPVEIERHQIVVRRVFQSPCPVPNGRIVKTA